jgi:hypothetical protein
MFSYIRKINTLYNEDDADGAADDTAYLFNSQTIAKWAKEASQTDEIAVREDIPPLFSYS